MKTRLTAVTYLGFTAMDRRFSTPMLPWLLKEISATGVSEPLSIAIEDGYLKAYNANFEPVLFHRLVDILRASQVPGRPERLFYILLNENEGLLNCYLFQATTVQKVTDLFVQMREPSPGALTPKGSSTSLSGSVTKNVGFQQYSEQPPWTSPSISLPINCRSNLATETPPLVKSLSNASNLTSLCVDLSLSDSHFFEVLYIGKVRISQRKVPETLIDDALHKLAQHEFEKAKNQRRHSLLSSTGTSVYSNDSNESIDDKKTENTNNIIYNKTSNLNPTRITLEPNKNVHWGSEENLKTKKINSPEIDKEFDNFSKERIEKNNNTVPTRKAGQVLEVNNTSIIHTKNNLGTVAEDEEKHEEITAKINETANSITQFCLNVNKSESNDKADKDNNPFKTEVKCNDKDDETNADDNGNLSQQAALDKINFDEVGRKPRTTLSHKNFSDLGENRRNSSMPENKPFLRDRSASIGTIHLKTPIAQVIGEQNRTMLFQVGRSEIRLISPDRKQILLHRGFKDISSVVSGRVNKQHIGFVCRETNDSYACYVFSVESESTAKELQSAIKQAFTAHAELLRKTREKSPNLTCEHCPMLWYHRLCHDAEGMNDKKTHAFILRRIEQLSEDEQDLIITKYQGGTNHMYETSEHNSFLMMLLRAHCEAKQLRHVHDTAENRSEFLNQYLGGSTIFMKAKRSLSNSFDHLLKRKASRDEANMNFPKKEASPLPTAFMESPSHSTEHLSPDNNRGKSLSPLVASETSDSPFAYPKIAGTDNMTEDDDLKDGEGTPVNSPMMEIFLKVSDSRNQHSEPGHENDATWRQAIYEKVLHPPDLQEDDSNISKATSSGKKSKDQLRQLWKLAIEQTVLLVRMERENTRLKQKEESSAVRRIKLEYTDLANCDAGVSLMWDSLLARQGMQPMGKLDRHMLAQAVLQGVPRGGRGVIWYFLAEQASLRSAPPDVTQFPLYRASYASLLANLTKHQHAILIDLGRTFPKHSYFASALGPGQLALYNILKAYSILDPEVGYCQGLSFVAGVLLLHMEEAEAFTLLRHLMFRRGLRKQYLPDMSDLQVRLYQLSRLLRDHEPDLHARLEALDISPALYAAPWMLTLFTSQFPLGFVVRVFDLMFLDSPDIVFSVSLALLSVHKDGLMLCESCEEAAEYLKHKLPDLDPHMYEKVMKKVHSFDIARQLNDYAVEYAVLREEMPRVAALTEDNRRLISDSLKMTAELDSAMDAITNYQKSQSRLETQTKMMEQQLALLSRYITAHNKQDAPIEVKRILQSYTKKMSFSSKIFSSKFNSNEEEDHEKKIFKTGASTPNLFAKINKDDVMNSINKEKNSPEKTDDKKHFIMKKSLSVHSGLIANNLKHYPLKSVDEKYERVDSFKSDGAQKESLKEIGKRNSGFFANTHEQIRQERMFEQQLKHDFDENLKKLDERLAPKSYMDDLSIFQSRKSMSLNLSPNANAEKAKLNDSGFVTPLSPSEKEGKEETSSVISHPLSDVDVDIKFDGNTQLKQIRPIRQNSFSIDSKQA